MSDMSPLVTFVTRRSVWEIWRVYVAASVSKVGLVACIALIGAGAGLLISTGEPVVLWSVPILVGLSVAVPVGRAIGLYRALAAKPALTAETTVTFYEWGIRTANSIESHSFTWDKLNGFKTSRKHLHIFIAPAQIGMVWPRRDIDSAQYATLVAILTQHLCPR